MIQQNLSKFIGILITCLLLFSSLSCRRKADPELFLIPNNYTGVAVVIFEMVDGNEPVFEGARRIYEIPESGLLRTKFTKTTHGLLDQEYYYSINGQKMRRIENFNPEKYSSKETYVLYGEYGYCKSYGAGTSFAYYAFTVGKPDDAGNLLESMRVFLKDLEYQE